MTPQFGVYYDLARATVTRITMLDYNSSDSEDNLRSGLTRQIQPGEGLVFIPKHLAKDTTRILAALGIK